MGLAGEVSHPSVLEVVADVARRCRKLGKPCGILAPTPELLGRFVAMGYNFVALASDMGMMMRQATAYIEEVRPALHKR
jgi:2-dehydro-3-deoxyglucarate aldolase/4-hydroxy-2-oxoheptanedioate aldolase